MSSITIVHKLCCLSEAVLGPLPVGKLPPFNKEDGEVATHEGMRRA
jgi:arsenate reductase